MYVSEQIEKPFEKLLFWFWFDCEGDISGSKAAGSIEKKLLQILF